MDHSILNRGGLQYGPELDQRCRPQLHMTKDAWKVDEPDVNFKGEWKYLYRTVDSSGQTLDFMFSAKRDAKAAQRFFNKGLQALHTQAPRAINVDKNAAYPPALNKLKQEGALSEDAELRPVKYLNHMLEPDHCRLKRLVKPDCGGGSFHTARRPLKGYKAMAMIRKGQLQNVDRDDVGQISLIHPIFDIAA